MKFIFIGDSIDEKPMTIKMLKMLLPMMLPIPIFNFLLFKAINDVNVSGKPVPAPSKEAEITHSDNPKKRAIKTALSIVNSAPK